ncbi:MAG: tetratricopeptide repeat protein [Candidatus Accumulibacter sp. UW26]|jgi:protein O-GlcNAc transferase
MPSARDDPLATTGGAPATPPAMTLDEALAQALAKALACHAAGHFGEAEQLYRAIVQAQPGHPEANHQLGQLEVQRQQPAAGLPHFVAALEARPESSQYWLSYIEALLLADQADSAREVLALGRQHGLAGEAVEMLALRLANKKPDSPAPEAARPRPSRPDKIPVRQGKPSAQEQGTLLALVHNGRYREGEILARTLTERFPQHGFGWKVLGAALKMQGDASAALAAMRQAAALLPRDEQVQSNLGLVLAEQNQLPESEACQRRALRIKPAFAEAHYNLGNVLCTQGRYQEAEASYRRALALKPDFALAHCNLGNLLLNHGRLAEAEPSYRKALALHPEMAEAHNNLGDTLRQLGRSAEAESAFRRALTGRPNFAEAHYNLGNTLSDQGRLDEAEACWRRAIEYKPDFPEALQALGAALRGQERLDEAEAALRSALQYRPDFAEAHFHLGATLHGQCRLDEAVAAWRRALQCRPEFPEALAAMGSVLKELGQLKEGEESLRCALQYQPDFAEAHYNLANNLREQGRFSEAEGSFRRALAIQPELPNALLNLGVTLSDLGRYLDAEEAYREALAINPDYPLAHSNLLFSLTHNERIDAQELFAEHCRFGERFEGPLRAQWMPHSNQRDPDRCLEIGFVSGDLHNHSVANFIEPVLAQLANYPQLSLHAYANSIIEDHVTQRLRGHVAHWNVVAGLNDADLAKKIRADGIDILIDLSGHTAHHRLLTFARKPAPVQASWIGYPGTTGLQAMDYFLADRFLLPWGEFEGQFTEKIVRLPASAPFLPFADAPPVSQLPALSQGHVTFGSFNRPAKIGRAVIALWSKLLTALPHSQMLLGAMPSDPEVKRVIDDFARNGVARDRLSLHPRCDMNGYLELHQQVDICLDTFPYTGGTTTLHALWMGVPTLTLAGHTVPGRPGAEILGHAGLTAFIANNPAEFVAQGIACTANLSTLASLRAELRERMSQSAMGQPDLIAAGLERALRMMWRRWCDDLPAEAFEVHEQDLFERATIDA